MALTFLFPLLNTWHQPPTPPPPPLNPPLQHLFFAFVHNQAHFGQFRSLAKSTGNNFYNLYFSVKRTERFLMKHILVKMGKLWK